MIKNPKLRHHRTIPLIEMLLVNCPGQIRKCGLVSKESLYLFNKAVIIISASTRIY